MTFKKKIKTTQPTQIEQTLTLPTEYSDGRQPWHLPLVGEVTPASRPDRSEWLECETINVAGYSEKVMVHYTDVAAVRRTLRVSSAGLIVIGPA